MKYLQIGFLMFMLSWVHAETATVAVASNFSIPMKKIAQAFEGDTGHQLRLIFGSSGKFYAQIRQGAPFDVFMSADQSKPVALENDGFIIKNSRQTYALGRLVLWSSGTRTVTADSLRNDKNITKLSIANPRVAPYGQAAIEVLKALQLESIYQNNLVRGENIAQAYQFVQLGSAPLGLVALSQVIATGQNSASYWLVPKHYHEPIRQDMVLLKSAKNNKAALAFQAYLKHESARKIIQSYGYELPQTEGKGF
ncbi:molybdate ABC transporter substrate-binding protein [Pleionea sp. CnH1-48]|uniref:molybdate ABC transporter substrate-binding protein n=1 Tax=Pleionea sp. CnH1-48 TaxID=2954494 RepID=UPI002096D2F1|nr:molybdate ABC transporter substrate-binding protein [Pleionea sp. CnH1-48]MCO7224936.1 molybdate ABC transporter substrate-binding protein [Pleionea sp. CnH1-48]